ncbi:MAG: hypothetical protein Kow0068_22470 [Marinilabiliales bacterium]
MRKLVYVSALLITAALLISSCGKYEEGPKISLLSKKARLCKIWVPETIIINGYTLPTDSAGLYDYQIAFEKDGSLSETYGTITINGTWEFSGDVNIITTYSLAGVSSSETHEILKLKNDELWLKHVQGTSTTETHFIHK